jgi:hypothetical protein
VEDPWIPPTLVAPADGAQIVAGTPIVFRIQTTPEETHSLWLYVSTSPITDAVGVIANETDIEPFSAVPGQPGLFEAAPTYFSFPSFWMNTPGTYYWQANRIHCYGPSGPPDCRIESVVRSLTIVPRPVTARIVGVGPSRACYISRSRVRLTAAGFAPGARVDLRFDTRYVGAATADANGTVATTVSVPSPGSGALQRRYRLSVTEQNFPQNTASVSVLVANLAVTATPSYFTRRGQKVLFRISGMVKDRFVYAHYRLGGRTRANVRLGVARGACGMLSVRAPMIPAQILRPGSWTVQFDPLRGYSPNANPRIRSTITVRIIG